MMLLLLLLMMMMVVVLMMVVVVVVVVVMAILVVEAVALAAPILVAVRATRGHRGRPPDEAAPLPHQAKDPGPQSGPQLIGRHAAVEDSLDQLDIGGALPKVGLVLAHTQRPP